MALEKDVTINVMIIRGESKEVLIMKQRTRVLMVLLLILTLLGTACGSKSPEGQEKEG